MPFPIGALLPHLQRFGGVRRFIELGNEFQKRGYPYTLYLPRQELKKARRFSWVFHGKLKTYEEIDSHLPVFLLGHPRPPCTDVLPDLKGQVYLYVIAGGEFLEDYQRLQGKYPLVLNNRCLKKYFPTARVIEGGVNTAYWRPKSLRVVYQAAKGGEVERELSNIPFLELIPLEQMDDKALLKAYQKAHWFVSWEERPGWANMAAEALSCGCGVVSNGVNTQPFQDRVVVVEDLRKFFLETLEDLSWAAVARKWERIFCQDGVKG